MSLQNKSRLRNTLKKLNRLVTAEQNSEIRAQEALDFLSMAAGEKPVMLLGRGYNEQNWIKGVLQIASDAKLQIIEGPFWMVPMPAPVPTPGLAFEYPRRVR